MRKINSKADNILLKVTFDLTLTFNMQQCNQKQYHYDALPGSFWVKDKETPLHTYESISRSIANYAVHIFFIKQLYASPIHRILDTDTTSLNAVLRIDTGSS